MRLVRAVVLGGNLPDLYRVFRGGTSSDALLVCHIDHCCCCSTGSNKRKKLVDVFNDPKSHSFAFLLSSKVRATFSISSINIVA